jgi:hypothetical protein
MNIHEYQAKQLLAQYGVAVPLEIPANRSTKSAPRRKKSPPAAAPAWSSNRKSMPADAARARSKPVFKAA